MKVIMKQLCARNQVTCVYLFSHLKVLSASTLTVQRVSLTPASYEWDFRLRNRAIRCLPEGMQYGVRIKPVWPLNYKCWWGIFLSRAFLRLYSNLYPGTFPTRTLPPNFHQPFSEMFPIHTSWKSASDPWSQSLNLGINHHCFFKVTTCWTPSLELVLIQLPR